MLFLLFSLSFAVAEDSLPNRFSEVSPGLFRSAQPVEEEYRAIKTAGIRTIINISDDPLGKNSDRKAAEQFGFQYIEVPLDGFWAPTDQEVDKILFQLNLPQNYPVLLHCQHGRDRTGLLVGLFRVLFQNWSPQAAYTEMLDRGFRPILLGLNYYYRQRTGYFEWETETRVDRAPAIVENPVLIGEY